MLSMRFMPIFEDPEFISATKEYEEIWQEHGQNIVQAFYEITGLDFVEKRIAAVVYEDISMSGRTVNDVMRLRGSYDIDVKKATLVHELGHRLIGQLKMRKENVDEHQTLFLFLYEVWIKLWGNPFADKMVEIEKGRKGNYDYESAWNWALALSAAERVSMFEEIKGMNIKTN